MRILTVEFKINFLKPAYGSSLLCQSEVISQGRKIIVAQSTVFDIRENHGDRQEKMVSKSTFTMMVVDAEKLKS
jgi:acyl-coenzyme A thioesterase PaaI-like protein